MVCRLRVPAQAALVIGVLAGALASLPHVSTTSHVMTQAVSMGVAGGFVMVVFFSFWGRAYGPRHLGRIQGAAQIMTVLASAVGPLLLAVCVRATGSYAVAFYALALTGGALAVAAGVVPLPPGAVLVAATDGLFEAQNPQGEMFGRERIGDVIRAASGTAASAQSIVDALDAALTGFVGTAKVRDDVTFVVIRAVEEGAAEGTERNS